jgi:GxxExxY protein
MTFEDGSDRIIGAAIEVHRRLGPGFLESVYEKALRVELARREISFVSQMAVAIRYLDVEVGTHVLDLLVEDRIVVELKAVRRLEDIHFVIVRSYLKAVGREHALLLNFAGSKLEIKRVFSRDSEDACRLSGFLGFRVQNPAGP